ncbi:GtrA family protein [Hyphomonas sp.]|uniref:GtrA family protein n=1 Tax=Hyphomonas sp. TaxID=87 RepID=UPI003529311B
MTLTFDNETVKRLRQSPGARYFVASLAALAVDYAVTLALYYLARLDLSVAAAIAFIAVGAVFYLVHEFWTFRQATSRFSMRRMTANMGVLLLSGAVRVAVIAALEWARPPAGLWVHAYFAAGVAGSFSTNYLLNRYIVFRR